jgi:hypothetical protein
MIISRQERQAVLKLLNISETARYLGISISKLHRDIRLGKTVEPETRIGLRSYFTLSEVKELRRRYEGGDCAPFK